MNKVAVQSTNIQLHLSPDRDGGTGNGTDTTKFSKLFISVAY